MILCVKLDVGIDLYFNDEKVFIIEEEFYIFFKKVFVGDVYIIVKFFVIGEIYFDDIIKDLQLLIIKYVEVKVLFRIKNKEIVRIKEYNEN